jgi:Holliday junction resolvase RusA-like endonuclease
LAEIKEPKMKGRAIRDFVELYNSGLLLPEGFTQPKHISRSGLRAWDKAYRAKGLEGLAPKYKRRRKITDNLIPMLPTYKRIVIHGRPRGDLLLSEIKKQWPWLPLGCPLMVVMRFFMCIPKGVSMRARIKMLNHERPHLGEPHLEGSIVAIKHLLKGIVWEDDSQIIVLYASKHYEWMKPHSEIFIRRLKG